MIEKSVQKEIDKAIKSIWITEICREYGHGFFLGETGFACSMYHHLRRRLDPLLEKHSLYIYHQFYLRELDYQADLAICRMDMERETRYLREHVADIAAIIELKYSGSPHRGETDIPALKAWLQAQGHDCQFYFGTIREAAGWKSLEGLNRRNKDHWANGCFTALNARNVGGTMYFQIDSYNGMNVQQRQSRCDFIW